jgi:hypothetical protein
MNIGSEAARRAQNALWLLDVMSSCLPVASELRESRGGAGSRDADGVVHAEQALGVPCGP